MDSEQMSKNNLKVKIPSATQMKSAGGVESHHAAPASGQGQGASGLSRQPTVTKTECLCSPTVHADSFRCGLQRASSLQRTKSIDSRPATLLGPTSKPNPPTAE